MKLFDYHFKRMIKKINRICYDFSFVIVNVSLFSLCKKISFVEMIAII